MAKIELDKRRIPQEERDRVIQERDATINQQSKIEAKKLEANRTEGYELYEVLIHLIFGPFLFVKPYFFNSHTLFTLRGENYFLKFRQRILIFFFSFFCWILYFNYAASTYVDPMIQEMEKEDISEWEKEHGYG